MKALQSQFCDYEQSLALSELGFDEPCFAYYDNLGEFYSIRLLTLLFKNSGQREEKDLIAAPLLQQAVEWLREEFKIHIEIMYIDEILGYRCKITDIKDNTEIFESKFSTDCYKILVIGIDEAIKILK